MLETRSSKNLDTEQKRKRISRHAGAGDWGQVKKPKAGLAIVVVKHYERANAHANDILRGVTKVKGLAI